MVDVGWPHFDAMLARVAHDLRRCIKPHWLGIQKCSSKDIRIAAFQPGRGIDQQGETCRMTLRKAVFAETLDLLETTFSEVAFVAIGQHPVDHLALESADGANALEGGHSA